MDNIITVSNLIKKYGNLTAVNGVSFNVKKGDLFAFLGPNGAGKSTIINILCTVLESNEGKVIINGFELGKNDAEIRNSIGVVFQNSFLDDLLTVKENIKIRASFYKISEEEFEKRLKYLSDTIGITDILKRRYGKLSGGQKRRVDIARALINYPKILFLDEPTTGLDPQTRNKVWEIIAKIQKEHHTTVFLTTHYLEEAANADKIAIIDNGKLIIEDTPMKLKQKYTTNILRILPKENNKIIDYLAKNKYKHSIKADVIEVFIENSFESLKILDKIKDQIISFEVLEGSLDTVFINLTGKDIRGE
jgi:multidrug/hemolysin transport system ATP-binding protein